MTLTNGGNGNGGSGGGNEAAHEFQLLGFIQANFKATPPIVPPFGSTTLSWNAQIPTTLHVPVTLIFEGQPVNHADSRVVTVPATAQFFLTAKTALTSRVISNLIVQVDTTECKTPSNAAFAVTQTILAMIKPFIPLGGQISEHGAGITVTMDIATLTIVIPLTITADGHHPTLDITMTFFVGMSNTPDAPDSIAVAPINVVVAVANFPDNSLAQQLSMIYVKVIAELVAPLIAGALTAQVTKARADAQAGDTTHRTFKLTSVVWDANQFAFTICPK
jgi:hypothetical protein